MINGMKTHFFVNMTKMTSRSANWFERSKAFTKTAKPRNKMTKKQQNNVAYKHQVPFYLPLTSSFLDLHRNYDLEKQRSAWEK